MNKQWKHRIAACALALLTAIAPLAALAEAPVLSPTTGLPASGPYRPVLVCVSNSMEARPAWNLSEADIVYESIIWGPYNTRYLAVYNDRYPEFVGSVRSLRSYQGEIRQAWDCPIAYHGGQDEEGTSIYDYFQEHAVDAAFLIDQLLKGDKPDGHQEMVKGLFTLREDRELPHNLVFNVAAFAKNHWPQAKTGEAYAPRMPGFAFSDTPSSSNVSAKTVDIRYDGTESGFTQYNPKYTYNEQSRVYERWYDGAEQTDAASDAATGARIVASNVIVQACETSYLQNSYARPWVETVGEGKMDAFIDGKHIAGTWRRASADAQTEYLDANGEPLVLLPGKTFIQIVTPEMALDEGAAKDGTFLYAPLAEAAAAPALSPTTGLPTDKPYRPILVSISNEQGARPQVNLSEADIVYESVNWSPGYTRYLAVYNDQHPEIVGALRGIRTYHMEMREGWDCPIVHRGGQGTPGTSIYAFMEEHGLDKAFSFDTTRPGTHAKNKVFPILPDRYAPHHYAVNLAAALEEWPADAGGQPHEPRLPGLTFSDTPTRGDQAADAVTVRYMAVDDAESKQEYTAQYAFDKEKRVYLRSYNGEEQTDGGTGKRIEAANVIVQYMALSFFEGAEDRPLITTAGGGPMDAYIDGTRVRGSWRREPDGNFVYRDEAGDPLVLLPGKTFVQMIPLDMALTRSEGESGGAFEYGR